jgi:hypothetical protein
MLKNVLLGAVAVVIIFVAVVATRPSTYQVERKLNVAAPADVVFRILNDLHQFLGVLVVFGSPWAKRDPNMQQTFEGPAAGVGQTYAWAGNREAGKGKMTIEESVVPQKVGIRLEFAEPMKSTAAYVLTIASTPTGSLVTWSMAGKHNFLGKAFGLFMDMDKMLAADIEKSLAELKTVAEGKQAELASAAAGEGATKD